MTTVSRCLPTPPSPATISSPPAPGRRSASRQARPTLFAVRPVLIFNDRTGHQVDLNLSGTDEEVAARHAPVPEEAVASASDGAPPEAPRGRGRPKLGVVPREVTLLPRHWDWLAAQPGGASVALRWSNRRAATTKSATASANGREAAYLFMCSLAGNLPGFEEATRAVCR